MNDPRVDDDDALDFLAEDEVSEAGSGASWHVLVVDDEPDVHEATRLALHDIVIEGRRLEFHHAYSAQEARTLLEERGSLFAVALLDVVMEKPDAGLELVRHIRSSLGLAAMRIILRTGQPGYAPEIEAIRSYDINDYKTKSELTRTRLYTSLTVALRSYWQLRQLDISRQGLEKIIEASADLHRIQGLSAFAEGVVTQLCALLGVAPEGLVCARSSQASGDPVVIAAAGRYAPYIHRPLSELPDAPMRDTIALAMQQRSHQMGVATCLFFPLNGDLGFAACIAPSRPLEPVDERLLEVFGASVSSGFSNVTLADRLRELAFIDPVLRIANRNHFVDLIDAQMTDPKGVALALVDIDDFATLNATLDQHFGDHVLQAVCQRLRTFADEDVVLGRISGDVFGLLGPATKVCGQRVSALFNAPFDVQGEQLRLSATTGLAPLDDATVNGTELLKDASIALKQAKIFSRGKSLEFNADLRESARLRMRMLYGLRSAFSSERLFLVYQPQVDLVTGRVIGAEALIRWRNEDGKFVPPDQFIPIAESSGLMVPIGDWVVRTAALELSRLLAAGFTDFRMAVNVSQVQFREPAFVDALAEVLAQLGLPPHLMEVELTESVAADDLDNVVAKVQALRALGVKVAMDDFGTGYSSLSILNTLPIDRIKIDRSFVNQLNDDPRRVNTIADLVVTIGHKLNVVSIAEGVETEAQRQALLRMGCQEGQGYLFGKPMMADDFRLWLSSASSVRASDPLP